MPGIEKCPAIVVTPPDLSVLLPLAAQSTPLSSRPWLSSSSPGRVAQGLHCVPEWTGMGVML